MKVHDFTVIASGLHPETSDLANLFFEAGCDDATIAFQKGLIILEFAREAPSFSSAIVSAYVDVTGAGAKVERFEPDYLVSLTDISKRTGLSKAAITHYHKGARAKDFPTPIARVTSESPLWDWHAVAEWMCTNNKVDQNVVIQARVMKEANVVVESIGAPSDAFTRRMRERVLECEPA
jgi:predicted DNA-binding transcriptional regulator AlpA